MKVITTLYLKLNKEMRKISVLLLLLSTVLLSCASENLRKEDNWEGVQNGFLQVFIVYELSEYSQEREDKNAVINALTESAKRRAVLVIVNYVKVKYPLLRDSRELDRVLIECFEKPKVLYVSFGEIDCRALVSFNIAPALEILERSFPKQPAGE